MAGPKSKKPNGGGKDANTQTRDKRMEKRAKGLADLDQLEKAVAELVRAHESRQSSQRSGPGDRTSLLTSA